MIENDYYRETLSATAELFISMYILDIEEGWSLAIKTNSYIEKLTIKGGTIQETLSNVMSNLALPTSKQEMKDFIDLSTLILRLKKEKIVSMVFLGKIHGWCSAKFIRIGNFDKAKRVLFTVENVDSQIEEMERLKTQVKEGQKLQIVVDALMNDYSTVCGCNLTKETIDIYKLNNRISKIFENAVDTYSGNYNEIAGYYVENAVYEGDKDRLKAVMEPSGLKKALAKKDGFSILYRNNEGNYGEMKAVRTGSDTAIIGFAEKHKEISAITRKLYEDSLTKINNRKFLDEQLCYRRCNAVVMADVDHFKEVNDAKGHKCGDYALKAVASELKACIRNSDDIARYGGDEFLITFPLIEKQDLINKLEYMRQKIQEIKLDDYPDLHLKMSFGGAYGDNAVKNMITDADRALYEAKKTRNTVYVIDIDDTNSYEGKKK